MSTLVQFAYDEDGEVIHECGWLDPWPPPEILVLGTGIDTGRVVVSEEAALEVVKNSFPNWELHLTTQRFRRARASTLTDAEVEAAEGLVIRCAIYVPIFEEVSM